VKKDFACFVTAQEEAKQTGKMKSVSNKKIIESPSAPRVNVRLFRDNEFKRNKNWKPTIDWLKDKQLKIPSNKAANEMSRHHSRIKLILSSGIS
jgi:hypothetical protein